MSNLPTQPTTTQQLSWYEERSPHTKAYDRYLMKQLIGSTVADVSLKEILGYDAVLGALERQVASKVNWDEVHFTGHDWYCRSGSQERLQELSGCGHRSAG